MVFNLYTAIPWKITISFNVFLNKFLNNDISAVLIRSKSLEDILVSKPFLKREMSIMQLRRKKKIDRKRKFQKRNVTSIESNHTYLLASATFHKIKHWIYAFFEIIWCFPNPKFEVEITVHFITSKIFDVILTVLFTSNKTEMFYHVTLTRVRNSKLLTQKCWPSSIS